MKKQAGAIEAAKATRRGLKWLAIAVVVTGVVVYVGLRASPDFLSPRIDSHPSNPLQVYRNRGADQAIIFVHGVLGNAQDTFTSSGAKSFWPDLLEGDPAFDEFDIYTFGYRSEWFSEGLTIDQLSSRMDEALAAAEVLARYKSFAFVAHSMGGLVTRAYLTNHQEAMRGRVRFIYFYGTPSSGSEIATIGREIFPNTQLGNMATKQGEPFLQSLQERWLSAGYGRSITSYCAYEAVPYGPTFIVPWGSAAGLCNQSLIAIQANHVNMVKPENINDSPHLALRKAVLETRENLAPGARLAAAVLIPASDFELRFNPPERTIQVDFRGAWQLSEPDSQVIKRVYANLQALGGQGRIPFGDNDYSCDHDGRSVVAPFVARTAEIRCTFTATSGKLTIAPLQTVGALTLTITFETEDKRGFSSQYCFDWDKNDAQDFSLGSRTNARRRPVNSICS